VHDGYVLTTENKFDLIKREWYGDARSGSEKTVKLSYRDLGDEGVKEIATLIRLLTRNFFRSADGIMFDLELETNAKDFKADPRRPTNSTLSGMVVSQCE